jgi:FMN-dependent NADH-azoreductase
MSKVLYIQASPRGKRSHSIAVADRFIEEYRKKNPKDEIITLNVFEAKLPTFDGFTVQAKYSIMHGQKHSADEAKAWKVVEGIIESFKSADKYVFAVPMWNFGIPYRLKQYVDIIAQPTYTFASTEKGYEGLVKGKKAFVAYARGGEYSGAGSGYDHQKSYLELVLGFVGITDVRSVVAEPMLAGGSEVARKKQDEAIASAVRAAETF